MDFAKEGRILYFSSIDVSRPIGPAVNEREFLVSLLDAFGERVHAVIPVPNSTCRDIDPKRTTFHTDVRTSQPIGLLRQQHEVHRLGKQIIASFRPSLIVAHMGLLPLALEKLSSAETPMYVKTIGDPFGFAVNNRGFKGIVGKCLSPIRWRIMNRLLQRSVGADACTPSLQQLVCRTFRYPAENLTVIENATNVHRFRPTDRIAARRRLAWPAFDPILGYIGGSPEKRGGLELIQLATRLQHEFPNLAVAIVGKDAKGELRHEATRLGIADRVILPGQVPYESIPDYMNALDIGYATGNPQWSSRVGNSYQKIRQYLACGKPIVTCASAGESLFESGLAEKVLPGDVHGIEMATRNVLARSESERASAKHRAIETAKTKYSLEVALEQRIARWNLSMSQVNMPARAA